MINRELAKIFDQVGDLLEITGGDRFRINSYRKVARMFGDLSEDVGALAERGEFSKVPGVGKGTADRIKQYLAEGKIDVHQELLASVPEGLLELLDIPGMGPKKVQVLYEQLKVTDMADLKESIAAGKVEELPGFGKKSVEKIAEGIAFLERSAGRTPMGVVWPIAEQLCDVLRRFKGVKRVEVAGSLRRGQETIGDVDLLCVADNGKEVIKLFTELQQVTGVRAAGETKGSVLVPNPEGGELQVDLRVVADESLGAALQYFTGSKEHNVRLRELAVKKGWRLNEYGLFDGENVIAGKDEAGIYKRLGMKFIPPELREDRGEIECKGDIPNLVTLEDIQGDLHIHSPASDGRDTIEDMVEAARKRGYKYIAITDHSKTSAIANGLDVDRLLEHVEDVKRINKKLKGLTVFTGAEVDILADGSLDYPDEVLAQLDFVVASIHYSMQQSRDQLTSRTLVALENPYVHALGHPSGRLLNRREAMDLDWEQVFKTAAKTGTALEISGSWQRLDLKDVHVRQAMDAGCELVINTDAHAIDQLDQMSFGVMTARRGWATKDRVLNTKTAEQLKKWLAKRHQ